jgi:glyoxylase-like metal-dependent hydrolase (beta-lactamase superfamily II)
MREIARKKEPDIFSCTSYLILGGCNQPERLDAAAAGSGRVIGEIYRPHGKRAEARVLPPHHHLSRAGEVAEFKAAHACRIYAFKEITGVDAVLLNGRKLQVGDRLVEAIHAPIRDSDAVFYYCAEEGALFLGDTPLGFVQNEDFHHKVYSDLLVRFSRLSIDPVYSGHDKSLAGNVSGIIRRSLIRGRVSPDGADSPHRLRPIVAIGKNGILHTYGHKITKGEILYV